jgi:phosphomannomutase/phosphoglucomutase
VLSAYQAAVVRHNTPLARKVKVVADCGNGVISLVAIETLRAIGCEVVPLFAESDGTFPNHHPDPTVVENLRDLQAAVLREGAELGIAFDGDGDRIGAVDERGTPVFGDTLLVLFGSRSGAAHGKGTRSFRREVLRSPQEPAKAGLVPTMWKTGHSLIKQKMKELHRPLAGE